MKVQSLLVPAFSTPTVASRFAMIERLCADRNWGIRLVSYNHDSTIFDAIDGFDGLFMVPLHDEFQPDVIAKLRASGTKAVALFCDYSMLGIPSLRFENPANATLLLEHLYSIGRRCVACVNTQPRSEIVHRRIQTREAWKAIRSTSRKKSIGQRQTAVVGHASHKKSTGGATGDARRSVQPV